MALFCCSMYIFCRTFLKHKCKHSFRAALISIKTQSYLWAVGNWTGIRCGNGGASLNNTPTFGGRGGAFRSMGETRGKVGEGFLPSSLPFCRAGGRTGNVCGRVWKVGVWRGWSEACVAVWEGVLVGVELWDTDLLCTAGERLGEAGVQAGDEGLEGDVKGCGGQLGVLRGGTGGKDVSKVGETRGLGWQSAEAGGRNLVLALGTGLPLSLLILPFLSPSSPSWAFSGLGPGTSCFSPPALLSSLILVPCLSLGTGFSLCGGGGFDVASSLFARSFKTGFPSTGTGTGLCVSNTLACPASTDPWSLSDSTGSECGSLLACVLLRLARMRLRWPGRVMPICSSWSAVRLRHCCNVSSPALWKASEYCSSRRTHNQSDTVTQDSHWDMTEWQVWRRVYIWREDAALKTSDHDGCELWKRNKRHEQCGREGCIPEWDKMGQILTSTHQLKKMFLTETFVLFLKRSCIILQSDCRPAGE